MLKNSESIFPAIVLRYPGGEISCDTKLMTWAMRDKLNARVAELIVAAEPIIRQVEIKPGEKRSDWAKRASEQKGDAVLSTTRREDESFDDYLVRIYGASSKPMNDIEGALAAVCELFDEEMPDDKALKEIPLVELRSFLFDIFTNMEMADLADGFRPPQLLSKIVAEANS